jgi:hypothetical protein
MSKTTITLYEHSDLNKDNQGKKETYYTSQPSLPFLTSSLELTGNTCIVYTEENYNGKSELLLQGSHKDHNQLPFGNDQIKSFQLLPENGICLFPQPKYLGKMEIINEKDYNLKEFVTQSAIVVSGEWISKEYPEETLKRGYYPELFQHRKNILNSVERASNGKLNVLSTYISNSAGTNLGSSQNHSLTQNYSDNFQLEDDRSIELIFDASGSMDVVASGEKTKKRLEVAKDTLNNLIENDLPIGIPIALRVFGPTSPNAEDKVIGPSEGYSKLHVALAPLKNKATLKSTINTIIAGGSTPIAASIDRAREDMKNADGFKLIVLITDGDETCGGDVLQSIENLCSSPDFKVILNVVGIEASNDNKKKFTTWAEAGNGRYYDATDAGKLHELTKLALATRYDVMDGYSIIKNGILDGGSVEVPSGKKLAIKFNEEKIIEDIYIASEQTQEVLINRFIK